MKLHGWPQIFVVALRDIQEGEVLVADYRRYGRQISNADVIEERLRDHLEILSREMLVILSHLKTQNQDVPSSSLSNSSAEMRDADNDDDGDGDADTDGKQLWAQCYSCGKWRRLHGSNHEEVETREKWFCHMNDDPLRNRCTQPEEELVGTEIEFDWGGITVGMEVECLYFGTWYEKCRIIKMNVISDGSKEYKLW